MVDIYTSVHSLKLRGILKEGWLVKKGMKVKNWKKRYFVLVDVPAPTLYYFKKEDSLQESGKIHLDVTTSARPTYSADKKHMMELVTPTRTYECHADGDESAASALLDGWIAAINQLTGRKLRSLSDPEAPSREALGGDTPLAAVIESTLKACKQFYPSLNQFIALTNKYQSKISGVSDVGKSVADLMYHLGAGGVVETTTGKELCKIATAIKQIETRKAEVRSAYIDHFVVKFQKTIEEEQKGLLELEKATKVKVTEVTSKTAKAKSALEKAKKKNKHDQVQQAQSAYDNCAHGERQVLEGVLRELLDYQEQRQRGLLVSWTEVIGAMEGVVAAESKLVESNARWRTESQRPINTEIPASFDFPSAPASFPDGSAAAFGVPPSTSSPPTSFGGSPNMPPPLTTTTSTPSLDTGNTAYKYEVLPDEPSGVSSAPNLPSAISPRAAGSAAAIPPPIAGMGGPPMGGPPMGGPPMGGPPTSGPPMGGPPMGGPPMGGPPMGGAPPPSGGGPPPPPPPPAWGKK